MNNIITSRTKENEFEKLIEILKVQGELIINDNRNNAVVQKKTQQLLDGVNHLKHYSDYITFLKRYSGLTFINGEENMSIYGFDQKTGLGLFEGEGDMIDNGFLVIGDYTWFDEKTDQYESVGFGINIDNSNDKGIYVYIDNHEKQFKVPNFYRLIKDFCKDRKRFEMIVYKSMNYEELGV